MPHGHRAHALLDVTCADQNVAASVHGSQANDFVAWKTALFAALAQAQYGRGEACTRAPSG